MTMSCQSFDDDDPVTYNEAMSSVDSEKWHSAMKSRMESMYTPDGFLSKGNENLVCKLLRTICGLKQASRRWNIRFDETIKEFDFIKNVDEPCVYKRVSGSASCQNVYLKKKISKDNGLEPTEFEESVAQVI
ncbi:hypothetical protein AgCh_023939 [Apium graveolens]